MRRCTCAPAGTALRPWPSRKAITAAPIYDCHVLIGRESESARIEALIEGARGGHGGALVIRGEPGIGKTSLLHFAAGAATGFLLLSATGVETEVAPSYRGLADLLQPLEGRLDRLPPAQAKALSTALGKGADEPVAPATAAATFALVTSATAEEPVLVLIDDLQWLDDASREVALFLARRSDLGGFATAIAVRDEAASTVGLGALDTVRLSGLSAPEAADLIEATAALRPPAGVAERLVELTAGNPLGLCEAGRMLPASQVLGTAQLADPLPAGEGVERIFAAQLSDLDRDVRAAVLTAAASDRRDLGGISAAAATLGVERGAFELAERVAVVVIESGELSFRHPMLRSVAYQRAEPAERRAVHRALADVEDDPERRARHLAAAATHPDETVAAALETAATAAARRGALGAAATSLALAARLTPATGDRADRLLAAATAAHMAGRGAAAIELADQAIAASSDPLLQVDAAWVKGLSLTQVARPEDGARLLAAAGERIADADPVRALRLLGESSGAWFAALEFERALEAAERCQRLSQLTGSADVQRRLVVGNALGNMGRAREAAEWQRDAALEIEGLDGLLAHQPSLIGSATTALRHLEAYDRARALLARWAGQLRGVGALAILVGTLAEAASLEIEAGEWPAAAIAANETIRLATDLGSPVMQLWGRVIRAEVAATQGDAIERETQLALAAELADATGMRRALDYYSALARGNAFLAGGEYESAASTLVLLHHLDSTGGTSSLTRWLPDLAEALVRSGRLDEARAVLQRFEGIHSASGQKWAQAAIARIHGLLDDDFDRAFTCALALGADAGVPFQTARTALCHGERLRRRGDRRRARNALGDALATFERVGARPWADRARSELSASGQTRAAHRTIAESLTPSEHQVAELVAEGLSNREIASRLFVSVRTVEMHVSRAYRKLGVRSRAGLARYVLTQTVAASPAAHETLPTG